MPSRNATVAEAVKSALNAASPLGGVAYTAKRIYVPLDKLEDLETLTVSVFAGSDDQERLTRGSAKNHVITTEIGIRKLLPSGTDPSSEDANTVIDPLVTFAEQVADLFVPGQYGGATWVKTEQPALADHAFLREHGVFFSVVILTFQLGTTA